MIEWVIRRLVGRAIRTTGNMSLERTPEKMPDPRYWGSVLNMVIMVLVIMKVVSRVEVEKGIAWARAVLDEV